MYMEEGEISNSEEEIVGAGESGSEVESGGDGVTTGEDTEEDIVFEEEEEEEEDGDRVSEKSLRTLGQSERLCEMLQNKHLRNLLLEIDQSDHPQCAVERAMAIPVFVEFADECLQLCGLRDQED